MKFGGQQGTLSFLTSPLIGYCSDVFGRKLFLMITVLFTCLPIPIMLMSSWWFFIMIALSGLFSVTFSVVFAYVADLTTDANRSCAYGQVSATFAASMIISPWLGAYIGKNYGDNLVILLASVVAVLDLLFIYFIVPESLPEKYRPQPSSLWEQADPMVTVKKIGHDSMIWTLCLAVFLSYLPEAGQYSCFFVYLKLVVGFTEEQVATFIACIGVQSVIAQTLLLTFLINRFGGKRTILIGLGAQALQLLLLGFGRNKWLMWATGVIASLSSITYPAISAYISTYADPDKQGLVQGLITGVRSLCGGIGPALFGILFNYFDVDVYAGMMSNPSAMLSSQPSSSDSQPSPLLVHPINNNKNIIYDLHDDRFMVGPPFVFGAFMVMLAALVTTFIPDSILYQRCPTSSSANSNVNGAGTSCTNSSSSTTNSFYDNYHYSNHHVHIGNLSPPVTSGLLSKRDVCLEPSYD